MKKYLLVDVNSIFYRSYSSLMKRMSDAVDLQGVPCVGTYGFFTTLFKSIKEVGPFDGYMFAYDCKGSSSNRKKINKNYKSVRKKKSQHFYQDINNLTKVYLPELGVTPLAKEDYEADDIIACVTRYTSSVEESSVFYILSGDGDMEQLSKYTPNIFLIKTQPVWKIMNYKGILDKWCVNDPADIPLLKAIIGDGSDCIQGVKGYKKIKALKVYKDETFLNTHKELIGENLELIKFRDDANILPQTADFSKDNLERIFTCLDSKSLLKRLPKIVEFCKNTP